MCPDMAEYASIPSDTDKMPPGIPYIIGNEAAERFSYYGMRTILSVFMAQYLHYMGSTVGTAMSEAAVRENYHFFSSLVYFLPIFGALVSDGFTGKYRIIMWVSVLYSFGHLALALMGTPGLSVDTWLWLGLYLIAFGAGGIKPCVSAHVGDQFGKRNQHLMEKVYQWFYFSINFGSTFSTILTPWLLEWYGPHIAFGVPGVLMAIATLMFWLGRHKFIHVPPAGTDFIAEVFSLRGLSIILRLGVVYLAISVFWALFDQTSSAWVLQAEDMNRTMLTFGTWTYAPLPAQIQVVNPILVLALIPVFQFVIYPTVNKFFTMSSLRKISIGLFLMALGFGLSAIVQDWIDQGQRPSIYWQILAFVIITCAEVMVSITGLEFSYAQAPKSMKSIIMAVWLFSVSLGNIVTYAVNHAIQVPSSAVQITPELVEPLNAAESRIREEFMTSNRDDLFKEIPSDDAGNALLQEIEDGHRQPLRYHRITRDRFRIVSDGTDGKFKTPDDLVLTATVVRADPELAKKNQEKPLTWLEKRIIELKGEAGQQEVAAKRGAAPETTIETSISVGGLVTLEGAAYYWFWTACMLAAAFLFIPIAMFYRGQIHLQDEADQYKQEDDQQAATPA